MDLPLIGYVDGVVAARSPEPHRLFYSNPDWALDEEGPLLLWDTFNEDFAISLARSGEAGWQRIEHFQGAMHSHLIHLPERALTLVLGVRQSGHPRALDLWWREGLGDWQGPVELFGGADFHAGSTPWAIHQGRLFVPFEIQQTRQWGSYSYGCVHAAVDSDLRMPGSWTLTQSRVPWTVFAGCSACGGLEGNLIAAPDGELYNLLRLPAYNRLGRARWNGSGWDWLGLVQGVHNQSKPEVFPAADGSAWYLLANGWPARRTPHIPNEFRNTLCLWEATEPDLSRWRLLRVVVSDRDPRHAFSYVAATVDPADDTLLIAERHGDDETHSFHDTNCTVVRTRAGFRKWAAEPALVPYGHDTVAENGEWTKANSQDGLLISHLDGALYPMDLTATLRVDALPSEPGALDLLGFATCDLVLIAGIQVVKESAGPYLALSTGGRRVALSESLVAGQELRLRVSLRSPMRVEVQVDDETPVTGRTHIASDPTLAGVLPRADRPAADLGRVTVTGRPALTVGEEVHDPPALPEALILADGRGVTGPVFGQPAPVENLVPGGPLLCGGHAAFFEPWVGGLVPGPEAAALWSPLDGLPAEFSLGGTARVVTRQADWTVVLAALGQRTPERSLRREEPYLALLLRAEAEGDARLAVAWRSAEAREVVVAPSAVQPWFSYLLSASAVEGGLAVTVFAGQPGGEAEPVIATTVPAACLAGVRHYLALIGSMGGEVRGSGGVFLTATALDAAQAAAFVAAGYALKMDSWPARRPGCANVRSAPEPAGEV